jgi:hypothetical protein
MRPARQLWTGNSAQVFREFRRLDKRKYKRGFVIQLRDREAGGWENPYYSDNMSDHITKPFFLLQHNWYKMMEYFQNDYVELLHNH